MIRFIKDALIYSGGAAIGRAATLFLLPFTTKYLTPIDYGVIGILTLIPVFFTAILSLGFQTSLGRIYSVVCNDDEKQGVIWSSFVVLFLNAIFWVSLAIIFSKQISIFLLNSDAYGYAAALSFAGTGLTAMRFPFEYYLRAMNRSKQVFALNMFDVGTSISLMLFMVIYFQRGARGYVEATMLSQAANLLVMLLAVASRLKFSIQMNRVKQLMKMGLPCIYGYWGYCILQVSSRYILQFFNAESEVGLYFLGSNIGKIIELPLWGFMGAWIPFFNSYLDRQEEAPLQFSKMMTYYLLIMSALCAALFCFARPVVELLLQPSFHDIWKVVGLSSIAQMLWGTYAITYPALIFHKKTGTQSLLELGAAGICIAANIFLIPFFAKEGAVIATVIGFVSLNLMSIKVNQRLMFTPYETGRLVKIIAAISCTAFLSFLPISQLGLHSFFMIVNLGFFYLFCWKSILNEEERGKIRQLFLYQTNLLEGV